MCRISHRQRRWLATLLAIICLLSSLTQQTSSLSSPPPPPPPPQSSSPFLFRRFAFAPNGVSVRPKTFYEATDNSNGNNSNRTFSLRNVEGTGDCMFQAAALATATSMGLGGNNALLRVIAAETRNVVAQILGSDCGGNLYIEGKRLVPARKLLLSASRDLGLEPEEYLRRLRLPGTEGGLYGGGPELTVLSNVLRRPISIYELHDDEIARALGKGDRHGGAEGDEAGLVEPPELPTKSRIKRVGVFGDLFKDPCLSIPDSAILSGLQPGAYSWHLHILIVDASSNEKHACVLLPDFCDDP